MVVGFNPHSTDIPFQCDEEFSFDENLATNEYFAFRPKGTRGRDVMTLVLPGCMPPVLRKVSH